MASLLDSFSPRLVDRYIFKQLMDYFLLGMVVFTLVAFFSDTLLKFIQDVQRYGIPLDTLLTIIGLQLPRSIAIVLPASSFLAVLMVYNHLNNQFELISMRMNGISLYRLMAPALVLGLASSIMAYVLTDYVVPYSNAQTERIKNEVMQQGTLPSGGGSFMFKSYDEKHNLVQMIYVGRYSGRELGDSTIIDLTKPGIMQVVQARSGEWLGTQGWKFHNANIYLVSSRSEHSSAGHSGIFWVKNLLNKSSEDIETLRERLRRKAQGLEVNADTQNFFEMIRAMERRKAADRPISNNDYLDLWEKITLPLSCFVIILSAVPLAITPPRAGGNRGFLFAIVILFLYYALRSVFVALGKSGLFMLGGLLPQAVAMVIAAWMPLLLMAAIGFWLLRRKSYVL